MLRQGIAAATGGIALAQAQSQNQSKLTGASNGAGRKFRAWVSLGTGPNRTRLEEVTLRPISGRQVIVRTEATNLCYSNATAVLGPQAAAAPPQNAATGAANAPRGGFDGVRRMADMAVIQGHGGVGVVEAVGPEVRRFKVGDRVCVSGTPQCGSCYQCLRGRADMCQFLNPILADDLTAIGDLRDGTPVYENSQIGGLAELMVTYEEWLVPVFTKLSAADLGMICSCVAIAGLGCTATHALAVIDPGSTVAVVGCGPLGLSAIQGARISGAARIIGIDPIRARRELALKIGATDILDPNVEGAKLIAKVREMSSWPTDRLWAGGRNTGGRRPGTGPDLVVEAAGADQAKPKLETGPDPTGILPMQQAYEMCAPGGHIITTSLPRGTFSLPAALFAIGGRTHHAGQFGGANPMRDIPLFVQLAESKKFDTKALATTVVGIEGVLEAYQQVLDRTTVTAIMVE
jgi:S-(hydroxymethyl)glutathione dehydrogenase / alcohol dehydrogenase